MKHNGMWISLLHPDSSFHQFINTVKFAGTLLLKLMQLEGDEMDNAATGMRREQTGLLATDTFKVEPNTPSIEGGRLSCGKSGIRASS